MASTYTGLGVQLMTTGEKAGTWGTLTNTNWNIMEQNSGGYVEQDISKIIKGAMKQQRLLSIAPKEVSENDLNQILIQSMENW